MPSRDRTDERLDVLLHGWPEEAGERELAGLLRELRADAPAAPERARERVRGLERWAETHPAQKRERPVRQFVLAIAVTLVLASLVGGLVRVASTGGGEDAGGGGGGVAAEAQPGAAEGDAGSGSAGLGTVPESGGDESVLRTGQPGTEAQPGRGNDAASIPPSKRRAQDYRVDLRLFVGDTGDLSAKTKQALALTRSYGGYVVSVDYDAGEEGEARLRLRVPVERVQAALVEFSDLGEILGQNVQIADRQGAIDARTRTIDRLLDRIADVRNELAGDLLPGERDQLERELAELRFRVGELRDERSGIERAASMARVTLHLTTYEAASDVGPGGIEGVLRDAGRILVAELGLILYGVIVGAPVALLALLAFLGVRLARRRSAERLLERA